MSFCSKCGTPIKEGKAFCSKCGAPVKAEQAARQETTQAQTDASKAQTGAPAAQQETVRAQYETPKPQYEAPKVQQYAPAAQAAAKSGKKPLIIILICAIAAVAVLLTIFVFMPMAAEKKAGDAADDIGADTKTVAVNGEMPEITYSYLTAEPEISVDYDVIDTIYPSLYSTLDYVVHFTATSEGGDTDVLVKAEIPGFSQVYEEKFTLGEQITQFYVRPPVLTGELELSSAKEAQIVFSVTDIETGKPIVQDTEPIHIMSKFDFVLYDVQTDTSKMENILAWLTPESDGVKEVTRNAIDFLTDYSGGQFTSFPGYQDTGLFGEDLAYNTYYQALGVQAAMSNMGVRYNNAGFSMSETENELQRIQLPDDVLSSKSGVCVETSLVMASALQSANMHAMLVFPPGHCQVAVETWQNSGEYFLIETTTLPLTEENIDSVVTYLTQEEWLNYLENGYGDGSGGCYVVDCDIASKLGILPLNN